MELCILVKYLKPTDNKGARLKAWVDGPKAWVQSRKASRIFPWDYSIEAQANKDKACLELIEALGIWCLAISHDHLTRACLDGGLCIYTLHNKHTRLEIPKK